VIEVSSYRPSADTAHLLFQPGLSAPTGVGWRDWSLSLFLLAIWHCGQLTKKVRGPSEDL